MVAQTQRKPQTAIAPPKRATKTASALAAAHIAATEVKQKRKRTKQGCITCRVRGKVRTNFPSSLDPILQLSVSAYPGAHGSRGSPWLGPPAASVLTTLNRNLEM